MLSDSPIFTILPAGDRARARAFYSEKLGLEPSQVQPNGDHPRPAAGYQLGRSADLSDGEGFLRAGHLLGAALQWISRCADPLMCAQRVLDALHTSLPAHRLG